MLPDGMTDGNDPLILARSTIHLPEIGRGAVIRVNPKVPYIAGALERGYLVPVADPAEPAPEPDVAATAPTPEGVEPPEGVEVEEHVAPAPVRDDQLALEGAPPDVARADA